jgi:phosphonate transport system substrate-binding protein
MKLNGLADTPIRYVSASDSVAQLVLAGEASAAFTSLANYQKLSTDMQSQLRFLAISEPMAGRVYVLNKRRAASREKIEAALWSFADSADGRGYFEKNKLDGYRKLKPRELEAMDPFAAEVRQVLKQGGKEIGK